MLTFYSRPSNWWLRRQRIRLQWRRPRLEPWVGKIPEEGNGYPLHYSCLENSMDREAWLAPWGHKESDPTEQPRHTLELPWSWWVCHLANANVLQWSYNKAQSPLEVKSSAIFYLVGYNQILSCAMATSFYMVHEVLTASILGWFAFPPPVDHILSELSAMVCPSWVALHDMAHSFLELHKPLHYNKAVIQAEWVTSWNQDRQEKHQQPQICGLYHSNGRVKRN